MPSNHQNQGVIVCRVRLLTLLALPAMWVLTASPSHAVSSGFIENRGQQNAAVRFYLPGAPADYYFTAQGLVVDLKQLHRAPRTGGDGWGNEASPSMLGGIAAGDTLVGCAVYIRFEGANPDPVIEAEDTLPTQYNYFIGKDESRWVRGLRASRRVLYRDLWPGVDLLFMESGAGLAYELRGTSGAVLGAPRFSFEGHGRVDGSPGGELTVITSAGVIRLNDDVAKSGRGFIRSVAQGVRLHDARGLAPADPAGDPGRLAWSTFLGGGSTEGCYEVASGIQGTVTVAGYTWSPDFPVTPGAYQEIFNQGAPGGPVTDGYVGRLSATGSILLWCTFLGGGNYDRLFGLALDAQGNVVVTGMTESNDFPTTAGALEPAVASTPAAFVSRISGDGSHLLASTYLGGIDGWASGNSVTFDAPGNIVVKGRTGDPSFPTTPGAFDRTFHGGGSLANADAYVSKLTSDCSTLIWGTYLGGTKDEGVSGGDEIDKGLAVDTDGSVVTTGYTQSPDFPVTPGAWHTSLGVSGDSFVAKLSADGSTLMWSTFLGGTVGAFARGLALDPAGNVVLSGWLNGDAFATKVAVTGTTALWSTVIGGSGSDGARGVSIDGSGNVLIAGSTTSLDFPTTPEAFQVSARGEQDGFVALFGPLGGPPLWSSYLGGNHSDAASAVAFDGMGNMIVIGTTLSGDFPITSGVFDSTGNGGGDDFITKFNRFLPATSIPGGFLPGRLPSISVFPDPFQVSMDIRYTLRSAGPVSLAIYDVRGRALVTLVDRIQEAGEQRVSWAGLDSRGAPVAPGVYFLRYEIDGQRGSRRVIRLP